MKVKIFIFLVSVMILSLSIVNGEKSDYEVNIGLNPDFGINFGESAGFEFKIENDELEYGKLYVEFISPEKMEIPRLTKGSIFWKSPCFFLRFPEKVVEDDWSYIIPDNIPKELEPNQTYQTIMGITPPLTRPRTENIVMQVYKDDKIVMSPEIKLRVFAKEGSGVFYEYSEGMIEIIFVYNHIKEIFGEIDDIHIEMQIDDGKNTVFADIFRVGVEEDGFIAGQRFKVAKEGEYHVKAKIYDGKKMDIIEGDIILE